MGGPVSSRCGGLAAVSLHEVAPMRDLARVDMVIDRSEGGLLGGFGGAAVQGTPTLEVSPVVEATHQPV